MTPPDPEAAEERAVARLVEMCADLRSCAIVGAGGEVLAESTPNRWGEQVLALWRAIDEAPGDDRFVPQVHIASDAGELFAIRTGELTAVALTDRFALESLMFCDLRAVLRDMS